MTRKCAGIVIVAMLCVCGVSFYAFAEYKSVVNPHPVDIQNITACSDCHADERAAFNHTSDFNIRHGFYGAQKEAVCQACHKTSFCADCHANKEELKPSDKFKDAPDRFLPHRGDYITQHRIDGKINPAPCMKCHGRKNNERCKACHR